MNVSHSEFFNELDDFQDNLKLISKKFEISGLSLYKFYNNGKIKSQYPIINKIANSVLSIPFSSTHLERLFSQIGLNKTAHRNSLDDVRKYPNL